MTWCPPDPAPIPTPAPDAPPSGLCNDAVTVTQLCTPSGPIAVVIVRDCAGIVTQTGWVDLASGVFTAGPPPAGAGPCEAGAVADYEVVRLCERDAAGNVTREVLRAVNPGGAGPALLLDLDGVPTTIVPGGTVGPCEEQCDDSICRQAQTGFLLGDGAIVTLLPSGGLSLDLFDPAAAADWAACLQSPGGVARFFFVAPSQQLAHGAIPSWAVTVTVAGSVVTLDPVDLLASPPCPVAEIDSEGFRQFMQALRFSQNTLGSDSFDVNFSVGQCWTWTEEVRAVEVTRVAPCGPTDVEVQRLCAKFRVAGDEVTIPFLRHVSYARDGDALVPVSYRDTLDDGVTEFDWASITAIYGIAFAIEACDEISALASRCDSTRAECLSGEGDWHYRTFGTTAVLQNIGNSWTLSLNGPLSEIAECTLASGGMLSLFVDVLNTTYVLRFTSQTAGLTWNPVTQDLTINWNYQPQLAIENCGELHVQPLGPLTALAGLVGLGTPFAAAVLGYACGAVPEVQPRRALQVQLCDASTVAVRSLHCTPQYGSDFAITGAQVEVVPGLLGSLEVRITHPSASILAGVLAQYGALMRITDSAGRDWRFDFVPPWLDHASISVVGTTLSFSFYRDRVDWSGCDRQALIDATWANLGEWSDAWPAGSPAAVTTWPVAPTFDTGQVSALLVKQVEEPRAPLIARATAGEVTAPLAGPATSDTIAPGASQVTIRVGVVLPGAVGPPFGFVDGAFPLLSAGDQVTIDAPAGGKLAEIVVQASPGVTVNWLAVR